MNIGEPQREFIVEPVRIPVGPEPEREPERREIHEPVEQPTKN